MAWPNKSSATSLKGTFNVAEKSSRWFLCLLFCCCCFYFILISCILLLCCFFFLLRQINCPGRCCSCAPTRFWDFECSHISWSAPAKKALAIFYVEWSTFYESVRPKSRLWVRNSDDCIVDAIGNCPQFFVVVILFHYIGFVICFRLVFLAFFPIFLSRVTGSILGPFHCQVAWMKSGVWLSFYVSALCCEVSFFSSLRK